MKKAGVNAATQQTFVVTVTFITQKTVTAKSESQALDMAWEELVPKGATEKDLSNWHAHKVGA